MRAYSINLRKAALSLAAATLVFSGSAASATPAFNFHFAPSGAQGGDAQWGGPTSGNAQANSVILNTTYDHMWNALSGTSGRYVNFVEYSNNVVAMNLYNADGSVASVLDSGGTFYNFGHDASGNVDFIYSSAVGAGSFWTTAPAGAGTSNSWTVDFQDPTTSLLKSTQVGGASIIGTTAAAFVAPAAWSGTSAPEIDGGRAPLAVMLLGLLFVVAKRKRLGALTAC